MAAKVKALQEWCRQQCDGYRDVKITNFTSSWKSGLAFCAIIHRYRPDLIDYDSLSKEDVFENNKLAFDVARDELGIPALLDPEDMVIMTVPDKLCIVTYVAQYYNYFHNKSKDGGPGIKRKSVQSENEGPPDAKKRLTLSGKQQVTAESTGRRSGTIDDQCQMCHNKVYLLERHVLPNGQLYHRQCFRGYQRTGTLTKGSRAPDDSSRRESSAVSNNNLVGKKSQDETSQKGTTNNSTPVTTSSRQSTALISAPVPVSSQQNAVPVSSPLSTQQNTVRNSTTGTSLMSRLFGKSSEKTAAVPPVTPPVSGSKQETVSTTQHSGSAAVTTPSTSSSLLKALYGMPNYSSPSVEKNVACTTKSTVNSAYVSPVTVGAIPKTTSSTYVSVLSKAVPSTTVSAAVVSSRSTAYGSGSSVTAGLSPRTSGGVWSNVNSQAVAASTSSSTTPRVTVSSALSAPSSGTTVSSAVPGTGAKTEWQLEAERRSAARNGVYVDPEKQPWRPSSTPHSNLGLKSGSEQNALRPGTYIDKSGTASIASIHRDSKYSWLEFDPTPPTKPPYMMRKGSDSSEPQMSGEAIVRRLEELDAQLREIESQGRDLEENIRKCTDEAMDEENDGDMVKWFALVKQRYDLVREESDLMYKKREQELESLHEELEYQLRRLLAKPEDLKTTREKIEEEQLLQQLVETVSLRNNIVDSIENDRIRYLEEDEKLAEMMAETGIAENSSHKKQSRRKKSHTFSGKDKKDKNKPKKKLVFFSSKSPTSPKIITSADTENVND